MAFRAERFHPLFDAGRRDELLASAEELTAWARATGEGYFSILASVSTAHVHLCRGAVAEAADEARVFLPAAREIEDPQVMVEALAVAALVELAAGRPAECLRLIEEFERTTRERPTWFRAKEIPELVRACAAAGAVDLANRLLDTLPVHARRHQLSLLTAQAVLKEPAATWTEPSVSSRKPPRDGGRSATSSSRGGRSWRQDDVSSNESVPAPGSAWRRLPQCSPGSAPPRC
jgi:hypothetical protein